MTVSCRSTRPATSACLLFLTCIVIVLAGCSGQPLEFGRFSINDDDLDRVDIVSSEDGRDIIVVPAFVTEYSRSGELLVARQMDQIYFDCPSHGSTYITTINTDSAHYWVIHVRDGVVRGPLTIEDAKRLVSRSAATWPDAWWQTNRYLPTGKQRRAEVERSCVRSG